MQYPPNRDRIKSSKAQSKYLRALISRVVEKGDNRMQVKLVGVQHVILQTTLAKLSMVQSFSVHLGMRM